MPQIRYEFIASGQGDIAREFRSISAEARASKTAADATYKASVTGASQATRAAQGYGREAKRPHSDIERLAKKVAADQTAAAKRAADTEVREAKRAADAKAKAAEHVFQIRQRFEQQADRQEAAALRRRQKAHADSYQRQHAEMYRIGERHKQDEKRQNMAALRSGAKGVAMAGLGLLGAGLGVVGGAAREGVKLNDITNRLSISARGAGEQGADPAQLRREFQAAALENPGVKAADIAEGVQGFVAKTGDLATGRQFASTFATTASATGADVQDIANAAADISQKFDIKGIEEMRDALAALTFQGKAGAFELKDAASQFARLASAASRFGLDKGSAGLKTLGGLTQIARSSTGSPEQAATAVEAMFRQLTAAHPQKLLKAAGVDVFQKGSTSKTRNIKDVLADTIGKTGGSLTKLGGIFGEEGIRAISPLISTFNQTKDATKGTDAQKTAAGVDALRAALDKAIDAPGDWSEVVKDAAQAQQSAGAQLDGAWESLKAKVADEVVPALVKLAPKVGGLIGGIDPAIKVFELLVDAAGLVVDAFKDLGIIKSKGTPEERYNKAKKAVDENEATLGNRNRLLTDEDDRKTRKLREELESATPAYETQKNARLRASGDKMTLESFAERYAALSDDPDKREAFKKQGLSDAKEMASGKLANEWTRTDALGTILSGSQRENEQQTALRHGFVDQTNKEHRSSGASVDTAPLVAALNANTEATRAAAKGGGGQPSITGAPNVGGTQ